MNDQIMTWSDITTNLMEYVNIGEVQFVSPRIHSLFSELLHYFEENDGKDEEGCERRSMYGGYINEFIIDEILDQQVLFKRKGNYWKIRESEGTEDLCEYVRVYEVFDKEHLTNQQLWKAAAEVLIKSAGAKNIYLNEDVVPHLNVIKESFTNITIEDFENAQTELKAAPYLFTDLNNIRWKLYELMGDVFFIKCETGERPYVIYTPEGFHLMETGERLYVRYTSDKGLHLCYETPLLEVDFNNVI
jgi:hypothetical protein